MNVNSIKINNVYYNGEVDLDELLPEAVEDLTVIKGLDENKEVLGAKNLLPLTLENLKALNTSGTWSGNNYTLNGITFTIQTDSNNNVLGIKINGTKNEDASVVFNLANYTASSGDKLNGCYDTTSNTYYIYTRGGSSVCRNSEVTISNEDVGVARLYAIAVVNSTAISNAIVYPMIRLATDPNPTYRPYAMSNQELTQRLISLEQRVAALEG